MTTMTARNRPIWSLTIRNLWLVSDRTAHYDFERSETFSDIQVLLVMEIELVSDCVNKKFTSLV